MYKDMKEVWDTLAKYMQGQPDPVLFRMVMEEMGGLGAEPKDTTYEEVQCPGTVKPAIWCRPAGSAADSVILYLHGGAFMAGSAVSHRKVAAHLAQRAGTYALVLDYRRAPEHIFPSQIDDVVAAYKWLLDTQGFSHKKIVLAGDSAGGHLTVAASLALREQGVPLPAATAAFSPWLDFRVLGKSYERNRNKDALAAPEQLPGLVAMYRGAEPLENPLIDILRTDLTGLAPMFLTSGTAEVLEDDFTTLAENAKKVGIEVQLELRENLQHIWICMVGNNADADRTLDSAAAFFRKHLA